LEAGQTLHLDRSLEVGGVEVNHAYVGLRHEIADAVPRSARRILDLGASDGTLGEFLLSQDPAREVVGVEINPVLARNARKRITRTHEVDIETANWGAISDGRPFDCIVAADVLEHLREPCDTLASVSQLLSADGVLVISLPNVRHLTVAWSIFVRGTFPRRERGIFDRTHLRWFTPSDSRDLCETVGLKVSGIHYIFRLRDRPGGIANQAIAVQRWIRHVPLIRELLAYQVTIVATRQFK
jgi:2-polyprenyl-3-methyl-5-hydroxy-6-metoxy-1,4-benzoquinol methylase